VPQVRVRFLHAYPGFLVKAPSSRRQVPRAARHLRVWILKPHYILRGSSPQPILPISFLKPMLYHTLAALLAIIVAQLLWIYLSHRRAQHRDELFRIITENAADMIALVDTKGHRLYNSPAYQKILGYSTAELAETPVFEQIHPDDRFKVLEAAREARTTGIGKDLQYRLRHKDGSWRTLESTASAIRNRDGDVEKLVIVNRDVTARVHVEEQLAHNALHDPLTGLPNRRLFLERLARCYAQAQRRPDYHYAVLLADLDAFKTINHSLGSDAGDQVLIEVARRLEACLRADDILAPCEASSANGYLLSRLSGDDFAILLEPCSSPSQAMRVGQRLQLAVTVPITTPRGQARCTLSLGTALSAQPPLPTDELLGEADAALRRAQAFGAAHCELSDHVQHNQAVGRLQLEADLRAALEQDQFRVFYQPIFRIPSRPLVGFEALLRWQHPRQGLISPREFLDVAEDTGLMSRIDLWVLREACRKLRALQPLSPEPLHLAVNLSGSHFSSLSLISGIRTCLTETCTPPQALQLGITEHVAMTDPALTASVFTQLRHLEVRTAIDGFGAGPISLRALHSFAPDLLKVDRTLVLNMQSDRTSRDVLALTAALAEKLPCALLAQGVETVAQLEHLRAFNFQFAQGYLFSPPLDANSTEEFFARQNVGADTVVRPAT